jgi:hypothetical protein
MIWIVFWSHILLFEITNSSLSIQQGEDHPSRRDGGGGVLATSFISWMVESGIRKTCGEEGGREWRYLPPLLLLQRFLKCCVPHSWPTHPTEQLWMRESSPQLLLIWNYWEGKGGGREGSILKSGGRSDLGNTPKLICDLLLIVPWAWRRILATQPIRTRRWGWVGRVVRREEKS